MITESELNKRWHALGVTPQGSLIGRSSTDKIHGKHTCGANTYTSLNQAERKPKRIGIAGPGACKSCGRSRQAIFRSLTFSEVVKVCLWGGFIVNPDDVPKQGASNKKINSYCKKCKQIDFRFFQFMKKGRGCRHCKKLKAQKRLQVNLVGEIFGPPTRQLKVIKYLGRFPTGTKGATYSCYLIECFCGKKFKSSHGNIKPGPLGISTTSSCGCTSGTYSNFQRSVHNIIVSVFSDTVEEVRVRPNRNFRWDHFVPSLGINGVAIESDGPHHYSHKRGYKMYVETLLRDRQKEIFAQEDNIPVIRIRYDDWKADPEMAIGCMLSELAMISKMA